MPDRRVTWYLPAGSGKRWPEDYERGRPGWPPDVVNIPGLPSSATVLDLAAGTGKLTRLLIAAYDRVLAVEPQDEMRRLLSRICPEAEIFAGTAEQIPLEASSVDVVFVAEAFHLFGSQHTVAEIARVLRLDGILILMWNFPAEPWEPSITAVERLLRQCLPQVKLEYDPVDLNPRRYSSGEWRQALAASRFGNLQERRLPNPHTLDRDGLVAFLASMGWIADLADEDRLPLLEEMKSRLDAAEYRRSWEAHAYWTRLSRGQ
jgi:SAM-dependent methyltransferase